MSYINLLDIIYPIGSLYFSTIEISPSETIGGTWTKISDGSMIGAGNGYTGCKKINIEQIPSHNHAILTYAGGLADAGTGIQRGWGAGTAGVDVPSKSMGGGQDYLPYHFGCHIWYRTS